jgi:hypothetical protein
MKKIPISNGTFALVDDDDFNYLSQFIWTLAKSGYAVRSKRRKEPNSKNLAMHRIIMDCQEGLVVDHINFNKLDNRKENLRIVTREINSSHQPSNKKSLSKPKTEKPKLFTLLLTNTEKTAVEELLAKLKVSR